MPDVHILGEISFVISDIPAVSITWAVVPGNNAWTVRNGLNFGETHTCVTDDCSGKAIITHPIDIHFQASTTEGWPMLVLELWDRTNGEVKGFSGTGSIWLPAMPGHNPISLSLWRPVSDGTNRLKEIFIPSFPNIYDLRELTMSPYLRSGFETETVGTVQLDLFIAVSGFDEHGVVFDEQLGNQLVKGPYFRRTQQAAMLCDGVGYGCHRVARHFHNVFLRKLKKPMMSSKILAQGS